MHFIFLSYKSIIITHRSTIVLIDFRIIFLILQLLYSLLYEKNLSILCKED
ncbi:hypothetical protein BBU94A_AD28 (plasmid) [Borreliella burgdorferi 94a]|nr:hypothetical protein BBU94A_AD28 [Borreliella burgdorferi 94a]